MSKAGKYFKTISRRELMAGAGFLVGAMCSRSNASAGNHKIAVLFPIGPAERIRSTRLFVGLMSELKNLGYEESKNLQIEIHFASTGVESYLVAVNKVIAGSPDVIFVSSIDLALSINKAVHSIPIVACVDGPTQNGLNLGNGSGRDKITGIDVDLGTNFYSDRLDVLREAGFNFLKPAFLTPSSFDLWKRVEELRQKWKGVVPIEISPPLSEEKVRLAFAHMIEDGADALIVGNAPVLAMYSEAIVQLATKYGLPAIYPYQSYIDAGGLISYGVNFLEAGRLAAAQVRKILIGVSPAEIPFVKASSVNLIVNLKAARRMSSTIADNVIRRADIVIK